MSELKSCPFCGGKPTAIETHPGRGELYCSKCDLVMCGDNAKTPEELTQAWNTRHVDDRALYAACKELVSYAGTCPFDARSLDEWSEYCERECSTGIDMAKCWERYFLECGRKVEG